MQIFTFSQNLKLGIHISLYKFTDHNRLSTGSETQNLSILSPFDEKEEWHKISEIINSFGATIGTDAAVVKESTTPNNCKCYLISVANFQKFSFFIT